METHLRRAVDNDEFHLVYQPQVDLRQRPHRRRRSADPLAQPARWARCGPDHFIGHAENHRRHRRASAAGCCAKPAGRCGAGATRPDDRARRGQRVVPPVPRRGPGRDRAPRRCAESGLPGDALELEFTERVLIEDAPDTLSHLRRPARARRGADHRRFRRRLQRAQLPAPPADPRPQAQPAVPAGRAATTSPTSRSARPWPASRSSLGLGLVAEGVENRRAARSSCCSLGVQVGQGFLFAPGLAPGRTRPPHLAERESAAQPDAAADATPSSRSAPSKRATTRASPRSSAP